MSFPTLPSGEPLRVTPEEVLRYLNPDGLRQIFRQERIRWNLKPNRDADFLSVMTERRYSGQIHNNGNYMRFELRTFPDADAYSGFAGIHVDCGEFGWVHNVDRWSEALSVPSRLAPSVPNRFQIGATAKMPGRLGTGLVDDLTTMDPFNYANMDRYSDNRSAQIIGDPFDGRLYVLTNDPLSFINNRAAGLATELPFPQRVPQRTLARIVDIPDTIGELINDLSFVADPDYVRTDNNFTHSNRFVVDNIDDRTFVYPEISRNSSGAFITNRRMGLNGELTHGESDGGTRFNTQPDFGEVIPNPDFDINQPIDENNPQFLPDPDRQGDRVNTYGMNQHFSGVSPAPGFLPGIFRSFEELNKVDLVGQRRSVKVHNASPGSQNPYMYYIDDGIWSPTWFDRVNRPDSYLSQSLLPSNRNEILSYNIAGPGTREPRPYPAMQETPTFCDTDIYQWRYNRVILEYHIDQDVTMSIVNMGERYLPGDELRWTFGNTQFIYRVTDVNTFGGITNGHFLPLTENQRITRQDPSTYGVGMPFVNLTGIGENATIAITCEARISTHATQLKNNLYAYVDVVPTVRSSPDSPWTDNNPMDTQDGKINIQSTAAFPSHSGINSGRGGPSPDPGTSQHLLHEHGGNATAGSQVHLFKYVINTQNPTWVIQDGVQVFLGRWVDQGPLGLERPCDIKALLFSNFDCNNFNNYYKFNLDNIIDTMNRIPDAVDTSNTNVVSQLLLHRSNEDPRISNSVLNPNATLPQFYRDGTPIEFAIGSPEFMDWVNTMEGYEWYDNNQIIGSIEDQRFTETRIHPDTSEVITVDVTDKVLYLNVVTGVIWVYNSSVKPDPFGVFPLRRAGWMQLNTAFAPEQTRPFTGTITAEAGERVTTLLSTNVNSIIHRMSDSGGSWQTHVDGGNHWDTIGTSADGNTGFLRLTPNGLVLITESTRPRENAPYDVWIKTRNII